MTAPPEVIAAAREYFNQGYQVVAVRRDKRPWGKDWRRAHNLDEVIKLLAGPDCPAIGFLGGELNHWIVPVDFDTTEGNEWFCANCRLNGIDPDDFPTVITPGKRKADGTRQPGLHRYMTDVRQYLGNATGPLLKKLGIDIRGAGHAMLPPSPHPDEGNYAWAPRHSLADFGDSPIPPVPDFLYDAIEAREAPREAQEGNGADHGAEAQFIVPPPRGGPAGGSDYQTRAEAYCRKALANSKARLIAATEGHRNDELNIQALGLGHLAHFKVFGEGEALSALMAACTANGLMDDKENGGPVKCHKSFYSGWNDGIKDPWPLPDDEQPRPGFGTGRTWTGDGESTEQSSQAADADLEIPEIEVWCDDDEPIEPRGWLLGNIFCRTYLSSLLAAGGTGKTAVRVAQALELASGKSITGEHIFQRCRVLYICLEDDKNELKRRVRAARLHHKITADEIRGWLYLSTPAKLGLRLATINGGQVQAGQLGPVLERLMRQLAIDLVILDPFIKTHAVEENVNSQIDFVATLLATLASGCNAAVDLPHHISKGTPDPGNADRGRGAGANKDANRLVYTLANMDPKEAEILNVPEAERRFLIRMDSAKVNIAPPADRAKWFKLISVSLGNGTETYPHGDQVQTIEPWTPPGLFADVTPQRAREILLAIDKGLPDGRRYSNSHRAGTDIAVWSVVQNYLPDKNKAQARFMVANWLKSGVLMLEEYHNPVSREAAKGLRVIHAKLPGAPEREVPE